MKQTSESTDGAANPWGFSIDQDRLAQPTILLVEDDRDIRDMIGTLLGMAGFAFVACDTAESALDALREQEFDLVLTDYALPRRSGLWLLEEAESEGLIQETPVLIVTAHPRVENQRGYEVIQKPFDLDELIERVRQRVEGTGTPRRRRASMPPPDSGGMSGGDESNCPEPVELILYVSSASPHSLAAVKTIEQTLKRYKSSRFKLTVCSLPGHPNIGAAAAAGVTPQTVRHGAGPRTLILGHITSPELLLELLADCRAEMN